MQYIFCSGQFGFGWMNEQAFSIVVVMISLIPVNRKQWEQADQLKTLSQYIGKTGVIGSVIIRVESEHTSGQSVHHILTGCFHNNVTNKTGGQRTIGGQSGAKSCQLCLIWKLVEKKEISDLLETKTVVCGNPCNQVLYIVTTIE